MFQIIILTIMIILLFILSYFIFFHHQISYYTCQSLQKCKSNCLKIFDYHVDFNTFKGKYNEPLTSSEFKQLFGMSITNSNCIINKDHQFIVRLLSCSVGSNSGISTKIKFYKGKQLPLFTRTMYLQYNMKFTSSFVWGKGGKLPGLGVGDSPTGCISERKGSSVRPMWRGYHNDGSIYNPNECLDIDGDKGMIYNYLYKRGSDKRCGIYYYCRDEKGYEIKKGEWYIITYKMYCNELGKDDGYIKMFINGEQVFFLNNIELISADCPKDEQNWVYQFSVFRGGSSDGWGVKSSDQEILFGFFKMTSDIHLLDYEIKENDVENAIENKKLGD